MTTRDRLRQHLIATGAWSGSPSELTDDYALLDKGIIDSLGMLDLVGFLEEDLNIEVLDDDLVPENFANIDAIAQLVKARTDS